MVEHLEQTTRHEEVFTGLLNQFGLDPEAESSGRKVVRSIGQSLVEAMRLALEAGPAESAQLVAGECVVHAETKDHLNWELMELAAEKPTRGPPTSSGPRSRRSRRKRTSISTTPPDGPVSFGSNHSA